MHLRLSRSQTSFRTWITDYCIIWLLNSWKKKSPCLIKCFKIPGISLRREGGKQLPILKMCALHNFHKTSNQFGFYWWQVHKQQLIKFQHIVELSWWNIIAKQYQRFGLLWLNLEIVVKNILFFSHIMILQFYILN